jgi:hypothetical protein
LKVRNKDHQKIVKQNIKTEEKERQKERIKGDVSNKKIIGI